MSKKLQKYDIHAGHREWYNIAWTYRAQRDELRLVKHTRPTLSEEKSLYARGYRLVAGVDEVGRGALVGPVVAAAVIMPADLKKRWRGRVRDSKLLSPAQRESLSVYIKEAAIATGIGSSPSQEIDTVGIAAATRRAMVAAINQLEPAPDFILVDFFRIPEIDLPQKGVVDGDSLCFSIACASIIAKVTRDRLLIELDGRYPGYGFAGHKGYGTREHLACLRRMGPCPLHRRSFGPVRRIIEEISGNGIPL
jgi:ribonuclease HII